MRRCCFCAVLGNSQRNTAVWWNTETEIFFQMSLPDNTYRNRNRFRPQGNKLVFSKFFEVFCICYVLMLASRIGAGAFLFGDDARLLGNWRPAFSGWAGSQNGLVSSEQHLLPQLFCRTWCRLRPWTSLLIKRNCFLFGQHDIIYEIYFKFWDATNSCRIVSREESAVR